MTTRATDFTKTSFEEFDIDIDFTDRQPLGATEISSSVFSALEFDPKTRATTDASSTVLDSTTGTTVSSVKARCTVKAGTDGKGYRVIGRATWDDGSKTEGAVIMRVEDHD